MTSRKRRLEDGPLSLPYRPGKMLRSENGGQDITEAANQASNKSVSDDEAHASITGLLRRLEGGDTGFCQAIKAGFGYRGTVYYGHQAVKAYKLAMIHEKLGLFAGDLLDLPLAPKTTHHQTKPEMDWGKDMVHALARLAMSCNSKTQLNVELWKQINLRVASESSGKIHRGEVYNRSHGEPMFIRLKEIYRAAETLELDHLRAEAWAEYESDQAHNVDQDTRLLVAMEETHL